MALIDHWPLYGLEVRTPRLALRGPDDDLAQELVDLAERGIHEPGTMPFTVPWTDDPPRAHLQQLGRNRSEWTPARWHCQLVAIEHGLVVGTQSMMGEHFAARRVVESGSWVGAAHQVAASAPRCAPPRSTSRSRGSARRWPSRRRGTTTSVRAASPSAWATSPRLDHRAASRHA